jgi:hypothetical protein
MDNYKRRISVGYHRAMLKEGQGTVAEKNLATQARKEDISPHV